MKFKGPVFPSFRDQQTPKPRKQWLPHSGTREQLQNLRRMCRPILASIEPDTVTARQRVIAATAGEPLPEFGALHLIYAAIDACDQTGEPWPVCMHYMLDKFEAGQADAATS